MRDNESFVKPKQHWTLHNNRHPAEQRLEADSFVHLVSTSEGDQESWKQRSTRAQRMEPFFVLRGLLFNNGPWEGSGEIWNHRDLGTETRHEIAKQFDGM